jgi:murein DD-endopeptidase MepM/ murein hydrolase activator NlpD
VRRSSPRSRDSHVRNRPAAWIAAIAIVPVAGLGAGAALGAMDAYQGPNRADTTALVAVSKTATAVRVAPKRKRAPSRAPSDRLSWPLRGAITGRFGEQRAGHVHAGIDIPKPEGTPIKAAGAGRVIAAGPEDGYGNYVCIAHVKLSTCYAHMSRMHTRQGARVRRGEVIGYVGNTGTSEAVHLHFEVRRGTREWGQPLDPLKYLPGA